MVSKVMLPLDAFAAPRAPGARPQVALGTMNFGKRTPPKEAEAIFARALERGIVLLDTANLYVDGVSEEITGRFARAHRDRVLVATKVGLAGFFRGQGEGLSKAAVLHAAEQSLARMGLDTIDLYYLHAPDHKTPLEDTLSGIAHLLEQKKIRAFGVSNYASWQIVEICHLCDAHGMPRPVIAQQLYNVLIRQLDLEYARFARKYALHTTVYNALAGGLLSGRYDRSSAIEAGSRFDKNKLYQSRYWNERFFDLVDTYKNLAEKAEMSLLDFAYAWLAGAPVVDSVLVGPATVAHLDSALDALDKPLPDDLRAEVDRIHRAFQGTDATYAR
jgi:aryl-alcohol dehydrogenase-like predicted oxidoreductase